MSVLETCTLVDRARDRHLAFNQRLMTQAMAIRFLSDIQRDIIMEAFQRDQGFLTQQFPIALQLSGDNLIGVVGAGTAGGQPAQLAPGGSSVTYDPTQAGALGEGSWEDTQPVVSFVPTSVSSAAATSGTGGWTVNAYAAMVARISAGPGAGPASVRRILSNTVDTIVLEDPWDDIPVQGVSVVEIVAGSEEVSETIGVITRLPARDDRVGYLVRLDASGVPFLDVANPISVAITAGIPLPPHLGLGYQGLVRFGSPSAPYDEAPCFIVRPSDKHTPGQRYALYEENGKVFFCGGEADWRDVVSVQVPYVPLPPDLTACGDYLLLPGSARSMLVSALAYEMALRADASAIKIDVAGFEKRKDNERADWMAQYVSHVGTARISFIEESE